MPPAQKTPLIRRQYNRWVANETLEDYALRYTAKQARRWSDLKVANTALGVVSFLALEAIGGSITLHYGFLNAFYAIMVVGLIIFLCGLPISYYAARYGVDIDLLSRGAGFGYIGSTASSLIYASFTFIFFAIEAAIMSTALNMVTGIPLAIAYLLSALLVIPLVTHGISRISRFQAWSQPLWALLQIAPLLVIGWQEADLFADWLGYSGSESGGAGDQFSLALFGACVAVIMPLIAQNGEQADFIRFLPLKQKDHSLRWWLAVVSGGPGWVVIGMLKLLVGSFLVVLALRHGLAESEAVEPSYMYAVAFEYLTHNPQWALYLAALFVILSQLKINVINAYAGSIAWSNFFSRLTHNHPGRIVWLVFNVSIALLLMELGLYQAFEQVLSLYAIVVVSWVGCLVADLVINKPLGLSPAHIEFRRSHLFDINPVGVGSMLLASLLGMAAMMGVMGPFAESLAPLLSLALPFLLVPLIAYLTAGRYYLNPEQQLEGLGSGERFRCGVCGNEFDREDMAHCPSYQAPICSLCCALDNRCDDFCRPQAHLKWQVSELMRRFLPSPLYKVLHSVVGHFLGIFSFTSLIIAVLLGLIYLAQSGAAAVEMSRRERFCGEFFSCCCW